MTDLHVDADGKEYFTDKDGRKWERRKIVPRPGISWIWVEEAKPDDRWVLERPVPETEEWVRKEAVRLMLEAQLNADVGVRRSVLLDKTPYGLSSPYPNLAGLPTRRLPREEKP